MNRKRKFNEIYKGVFKNDKKSCLIDLKPLDKKRELEKEPINKKDQEDTRNLNNFQKEEYNSKLANKNKNRLGINLRVAKNLGFGSFFRKVREEISDIFLSKEEYISFEGLINSNSVNDLFNFRDSTSKNFIDKEIINLENTSKKENMHRNPQSYANLPNNTTELVKRQEDIGMSIINDEEDEIVYEDECETIYKKRKLPQNLQNLQNLKKASSNQKFQLYYDNSMNPQNENQHEIEKDSFNLSNLNSMINLKQLNKRNNLNKMSNMVNFHYEKILDKGENFNLGNMTNFSNLSRGNNIASSNFNQFIPTNSKHSKLMTNRNILDIEDDPNVLFYKMKQHTRTNKIPGHLLLSEDDSIVGDNIDILGLKAIKQVNNRGPLSNIINNFQDY
jgi:hypothetical protein